MEYAGRNYFRSKEQEGGENNRAFRLLLHKVILDLTLPAVRKSECNLPLKPTPSFPGLRHHTLKRTVDATSKTITLDGRDVSSV